MALSAVLALALAACGDEAVVEPQIVEVEKEIIVEKEVVKEVEVEVVVEKEVIKEVKVPGETIVVTKEVQIQKFREAPMLAQLVAAGKLPPVEERLPVKSDVMVIPAIDEVGKYGGSLRRVLIGPGDVSCNVGRVNGMAPFRYTMDGTELVAHTAKGMEPNSDGSEWTVNLREGLKWSDGAPFTADDWIFRRGNSRRSRCSIGPSSPRQVRPDRTPRRDLGRTCGHPTERDRQSRAD